METTLSKDVQEKLDRINWDSLKDKYGISRDTFYNNLHLASQLAYGQMTDLVFAKLPEEFTIDDEFAVQTTSLEPVLQRSFDIVQSESIRTFMIR